MKKGVFDVICDVNNALKVKVLFSDPVSFVWWDIGLIIVLFVQYLCSVGGSVVLLCKSLFIMFIMT